jgi:hypothetical protein
VLFWLIAFGGLVAGLHGEPAVTPPLPREAAQAQQSEPAAQPPKKSKKSSRYMEGFLLKGTVFTEQGFSLPNAELLIRRARERKFRWSVRTDSRGEFAIRVPKGADYEMSARAPGYQEQNHVVDAKAGEGEDGIIFHMPPSAGGKSK